MKPDEGILLDRVPFFVRRSPVVHRPVRLVGGGNHPTDYFNKTIFYLTAGSHNLPFGDQPSIIYIDVFGSLDGVFKE